MATALLALGLAACAAPGPDPITDGSTVLKGAEIEALLARQAQWTFRSSDGARGTSSFHPDGRSEVSWRSGVHSGEAVGKAWVEGDKLCAQYPTLRDGARICGRMVRLDADRYRLHKDSGGTTTYTAAH